MPDPTFFDSPSDRETLTRLAATIERAYTKTGVLIWRSFLQGFVSALGAASATVLVLCVAILLFKNLGGPGLVQNFINTISASVVHQQEQTVIQSIPTPK